MLRRLKSVVLHGLISAAIAVILLLCMEGLLRQFWPQSVEISDIDGEPLGRQDSHLGYRYRPNAHTVVQGPEYSAEYRINEDGMRDESDHLVPRPSDVTRILLLGDSFTFGQGVDYEQIWPVIFERRLLENGFKAEVVKAGVQGYDTQQEVLYLEQLFPRYDPDVVILTFLPNDLFTDSAVASDVLDHVEQNKQGQFFRRSLEWLLTFHSVQLAKRLLTSSDYLYTRLYMLTPWPEYFTLPMSDRLNRRLELTKQLLTRAKRYCQQRGATFLVLSIPQQFQVLAKAHEYDIGNMDINFIDETLSDFAIEQQFRWIETLELLTESYRRDGEAVFLRVDGHLNEKGNLLVGNYLFGEHAHQFVPD